MEAASVRSSIELCGSVLRYAELERHGLQYRLLRLGDRTFDFDLVDAVCHATNTAHWTELRDALRSVFAESSASRHVVTLHPAAAHSFFSAVPADVKGPERAEQLRREAAVLMQANAPRPLRLTADAVYNESRDTGTVEWLHVLALEEDVQERIDRLVEAVPQAGYRLMLSTHAVAATVGHVERREGSTARRGPYTLAVGWYPAHVEYVLCRDGYWQFGRHEETSDPADCAYSAAALLQHLQVAPEEVGRLLTYGEGEAAEDDPFAPLATTLHLRAEPLRPSHLVRTEASTLELSVDATPFTPCVGAAL